MAWLGPRAEEVSLADLPSWRLSTWDCSQSGHLPEHHQCWSYFWWLFWWEISYFVENWTIIENIKINLLRQQTVFNPCKESEGNHKWVHRFHLNTKLIILICWTQLWGEQTWKGSLLANYYSSSQFIQK